MSLADAFEQGVVWAEVKRIADLLAGGISVSVIPENREPFVNLPGLRGYWPMSVVDFLGNAKDHSDASSDLARSGSPTFGYDGNAFVQCGVANDFLQGSTSAQDVTGTEAWIDPTIRGLTWGSWVKVDAVPTVVSGMVGIWPNPPQASYSLYWATTNLVYASVSGNGTTEIYSVSASQAISEWIFIVGRFTPSTEIAIFVNGTKSVNTTSVPASLHNSTAPFEISRMLSSDTRILEAKYRDIFLCQTALTDVQIENLRLSSLPS